MNSRGEPADTGDSRAITFNPIGNRGRASFLVNALNLALFHGVGDDLTLNGSIDFVPRWRDVSNPAGIAVGDFVDIKLAYADYRTGPRKIPINLYVGKFDSVLGIEYRIQDAPDRLGVTPSLICRYTCGRPLGLKARAQFFDEAVTAMASVTNGSSFVEMFPFSAEIDQNHMKTGSGRLAGKVKLGAAGHAELGVSGAYGAQDTQRDEGVTQWHGGLDARLEYKDLDVRAEYVEGQAAGLAEAGTLPCSAAPCLRYRGAYGLAGFRLLNWMTPFTRVDWRDAVHQSGASFVYISEVMRVTSGLRFELGTNIVVKTEFTANLELGLLPRIPNNIFTSAFVAKF